MGSWFFPAREATAEQLAATGAAGGGGADPIDGDYGFRQVGGGSREVPAWTLEKARAYSVSAWRMNPMARAIIDTYTSFCVGDSGVTLQCIAPVVRVVAEEFWDDPRNRVGAIQDALLRDHMLMGETALEMMVGSLSGVTRFSPINTTRVTAVDLDRGNPLWPAAIHVRGIDEPKTVVHPDDLLGLRIGEVQWWTSGKALLDDRRGSPFLSPIIDWLDSYDTVLFNLIDRTALARYIAFDVTLDGAGTTEINDWIQQRGGLHAPRSGTVEVHNDKVKWEPVTAETGSFEDTNTAKALMTNIAGGAGLAKTWLAEPEDSNRATSLTMAEPVRRRVGGVQKVWLEHQAELVRFAVDQAVASGRLTPTVRVAGDTGPEVEMRASQTVRVNGPEVAAADAQITAEVLVNMSQGLDTMVSRGLLTPEAAQLAAKKAWENFMGIPYSSELGKPDANTDDVATHVDDSAKTPAALTAV